MPIDEVRERRLSGAQIDALIGAVDRAMQKENLDPHGLELIATLILAQLTEINRTLEIIAERLK